jgi:hypothetical protein
MTVWNPIERMVGKLAENADRNRCGWMLAAICLLIAAAVFHPIWDGPPHRYEALLAPEWVRELFRAALQRVCTDRTQWMLAAAYEGAVLRARRSPARWTFLLLIMLLDLWLMVWITPGSLDDWRFCFPAEWKDRFQNTPLVAGFQAIWIQNALFLRILLLFGGVKAALATLLTLSACRRRRAFRIRFHRDGHSRRVRTREGGQPGGGVRQSGNAGTPKAPPAARTQPGRPAKALPLSETEYPF